MKTQKTIVTLTLLFSLIGLNGPVAAGARDLGRETLPVNDGWASQGSGTTGGSMAIPSRVYHVTNRTELISALNNGIAGPFASSPSNPPAEPRIIYVHGVIDMNVDDNNQPLSCEDYYQPPYTLEAFLATYDPEVWGRVAPSGPMETARAASRVVQERRVRIRIGSNTTIVGWDKHATIRGGWFDLRGPSSTVNRSNIIIRNLTFEDTFDCFTAWDPTDGALGAWNAAYDAVSLRNVDHVWIDHNTFIDRQTADQTLPHYFGVVWQVHDGLLDITNASDFVTVSWNRFEIHDKVMLIGSSDSATADRGKLNVSLHHNHFKDLGQRAPRVRYGKVHIYNNYYEIRNAEDYGYSWGVGVESRLYAENNFFWIKPPSPDFAPEEIIERLASSSRPEGAIYETGTMLKSPLYNGRSIVDIFNAYNAANDPDVPWNMDFVPTLFNDVMETRDVFPAVKPGAGPLN